MRDGDDPAAEAERVEEDDDGIGEESAMLLDIGLADGEHGDCEGDVECVGESDYGQDEAFVGLKIEEEAEGEDAGDHEHGVEGEEVGGERDDPIRFGDGDAAATRGDAKSRDTGAHEQRPEGMGEFVSEDVGAHGAGEEEIEEQPEEESSGEPPSGLRVSTELLDAQRGDESRGGADGGPHDGQEEEANEKL